MKLCNIIVLLATVAAVGASHDSSSSSSSGSSPSGRERAEPSEDADRGSHRPSLRGIAPSDEEMYNPLFMELGAGGPSRKSKRRLKKSNKSNKVKGSKSSNTGGNVDPVAGDGVTNWVGANRASNRNVQCTGTKESCNIWETIPVEKLCLTDGECKSCCCSAAYLQGQWTKGSDGQLVKERGCIDVSDMTDAALNACVNPRMVEEEIDTGGGLDGGGDNNNNLDSNLLP
mmetsp:Transcript_60939/g.180409  ORF Transcript_60939/g.180409 Transcript_60939/m.180409 type:complete len:229 (-) Transcript_60939:192-878(-)